MSDETKNHCQPETTAPKMEVHDASEGSKDIKPKLVSTAHKRLSQDEFQRKVAMVARLKAAADMEKDAFGAVLKTVLGGGGRAAASAALRRAARRTAAKTVSRAATGSAAASAATGTAAKPSFLRRLFSRGTKAAPATAAAAPAAPAAAATTAPTLFGRALGVGKGALGYYLSPFGIVMPNMFSSTGFTADNAAVPVGHALKNIGTAMAGGGNNSQGFGNMANLGMLGALGGGAIGAMMPGEEEYEDEDGQIRKRRGNMLAGALRGAGLGGLAGGGIGAGMDYMGKMSAAQEFGEKIAGLEKQSVGAVIPDMSQTSGTGGVAASNPHMMNSRSQFAKPLPADKFTNFRQGLAQAAMPGLVTGAQIAGAVRPMVMGNRSGPAVMSNMLQRFAPKPETSTYSLPGGGGGTLGPQKSIFSR